MNPASGEEEHNIDAADVSMIPLVEELSSSLDPWDVCRRLAHLPQLLFLDSATADDPHGRYSFVTADPFAWLQARDGRVSYSGPTEGKAAGDPFRALQHGVQQWTSATVAGLPPFQGGIAGLFGYDLCQHLERLPRPAFDEFQTPDLAVGFYDWVIAFDHVQRRSWLISTGLPRTAAARKQWAAVRLRSVLGWLKSSAELSGKPRASNLSIERALTIALRKVAVPELWNVYSNFSPAEYKNTVQRVLDYIHAGDCFQVNLAQRLLHRASIAPLELYARLRERNAAPFAAYFDLGEFVIASASPERFLRVERGEVETRPIKGTRPRGATPEEDQRRAAELLNSSKDRAENVMIIDLMRNDLGRVCEYGSVRVQQVCGLESYRTVHHLVSEVRGRLRPGLGPIDLLRAAFPGGSVTGAPKVRAMEIIAELEPTARGPYCGCLGYLGFDGTMDTNLLIRTFTIGKGWIQFPVGGGIVADSDPDSEYAETLHKAEGLLLGAANLNEAIMSDSTATTDRPRLSGLALAGLLLGLAAPFTLVTGPFALYFSYRALYVVNASDGRLRGRSAAFAGLLLGGVTTLVGVIGSFALIIATVKTADARVQCANNMRVIGAAAYQYHDNHDKIFPRAVVPLEGVPPEQRASWFAAVLPYLDPKGNRQTKWEALAGRLDLQKPWDDPANREALTFHVPFYQCPGAPNFDPHKYPSLTHYAGVAGVGDDAASLPKDDPRAGFFGYDRDVSVGSSYKMMMLETTQHNGDWIVGGPPTVRGVGFDPTFLNWEGATLFGLLAAPQDDFGAPVGAALLVPRPEGPSLIGPERPFGGCHQGGLNVLWADGSVRFVNDTFPSHTLRMQASLSEDAAVLANLP